MRVAIFYSLVFFTLFPFAVDGQLQELVEEMPEAIKDAETVVKNWKKLEHLITNAVSQGTKSLMSTVMDEAQQLNISSTCIRDGIQVLNGMRRLETWAMRFLDSSAKGVDGGITGTMHSFGSFDECIDTVAINKRAGKQKGKVMFTGKYCLLRIKPTLPPNKKFYNVGETMEELRGLFKSETVLSEVAKYASLLYYSAVRLGVCVPSGCSNDDLGQLLKKVYNETGLIADVKRCEIKEEPTYTPVMIFVLCLYSFFGLLVLMGTLIDTYCYYSKRKLRSMPVRILLTFSFLSNFRKVMDTSCSNVSLKCVHGIRFITMSWIILSHTYVMTVNQIVTGLMYAKSNLESVGMQVMLRSVSGDTFLFLGGFLLCYLTTTHVVINKNRLNIKLYVFHRLWRIIPTYAFFIMVIFILELMTSGPLAYTMINAFAGSCKETFWLNLLFVNNYASAERICLPYTWYLALDMQFYLASLIILLPLFRYPKVGLTIAITLGVGFMVSSAVIPYINDYGPTEVFASPDFGKMKIWVKDFYVFPYPHATGYIIALLTGYFLAMKPKFEIPKLVQLLGWSIAITLGMLVIYGPLEWIRGREPTMWESIFFNGCMRPAWSLSLSWMVICCATGHGGIVNYILSWKIWIPLGRLTFTAYLVHPLLQTVITGSYRTLLSPHHVQFIYLWFGHLIASYGIAFIVTMMIEAPSIALEKLILPQREKKGSSTKPVENSNNQFITAAGIVNGKNPDNVDYNSTVLRSYKDIECKQ